MLDWEVVRGERSMTSEDGVGLNWALSFGMIKSLISPKLAKAMIEFGNELRAIVLHLTHLLGLYAGGSSTLRCSRPSCRIGAIPCAREGNYSTAED